MEVNMPRDGWHKWTITGDAYSLMVNECQISQDELFI